MDMDLFSTQITSAWFDKKHEKNGVLLIYATYVPDKFKWKTLFKMNSILTQKIYFQPFLIFN